MFPTSRSRRLRGFRALLLAPFLGVTPFGPYVEVPGERELSGWVIVRPLPLAALRGRGLDAAAAVSRRELARQELATCGVDEYVAATDEYIVRVPAGETANELAARLQSLDLYQYAEPDWLLHPLGCPDDSRFDRQYHHDVTKLKSCSGWTIHAGLPSAGVGLCDTGVRTTHEDLQLHRREGYNAVDRRWESQDGDIGSINVHGTLTTGCAAANGDNEIGVAGMGWNLSHRMLRVTNDPSGVARMSDIQHAARTAIEAGDRVASVSYAGVEFLSNLSTATYIKSIGGLLVWGAGNSGDYSNFSPRDADDILVVGATDEYDEHASFSVRGPFVDLVAPGVGVYTTGGTSDAAYGAGTGTSFSTPLVAGLCALIFSAAPHLAPDEVELVLKVSCDDLGTPGVDNVFGYGRIDIYTAMLLVRGGGVPVGGRVPPK
ncbi:MAG: S8 family serine peptidase [Planctomycetota bacterium]